MFWYDYWSYTLLVQHDDKLFEQMTDLKIEIQQEMYLILLFFMFEEKKRI